jgi:hypothetical protein
MANDPTGAEEARTVAELLRAGTPTTGDAVRTAVSLADQVAALHAAGRAHGHVGPETVLVDAWGAVTLAGPVPLKTGAAAPAELRAADLLGVGRVLADLLGWHDTRRVLPGPVALLIDRAEAADAPASALASALSRLERNPSAVAALMPARQYAVRAEPAAARVLDLLVPRGDRRITGVVAGVLAGAAAVGVLLLLVGTPASTAPESRAEAAIAAPTPAATDEAALQALTAPLRSAASSPSAGALLRPAKTTPPTLTVRRAVPSAQAARAEVAAPVATLPTVAPTTPTSPRPADSSPPVSQQPAPASSAPSAPAVTPVGTPSAPVGTPSAPTAQPKPTVPASKPAAPGTAAPPTSAAPPKAAPRALPTTAPSAAAKG